MSTAGSIGFKSRESGDQLFITNWRRKIKDPSYPYFQYTYENVIIQAQLPWRHFTILD